MNGILRWSQDKKRPLQKQGSSGHRREPVTGYACSIGPQGLEQQDG